MLGFGPLGKFPLGGGPYGVATITTIGWYAALTDPVRFKRAPRAAVAVNNQTLAFNPLPVVSFGWMEALTEPVRFKENRRALHPTTTFNPLPVVSFGWFEELSKPRTLEKRGLKPTLQQTLAFQPRPFVSFGWFGNLSDPVRVKPRLRTALQQFLANDTQVIPTSKLIQWFSPLSDPVRIKRGLRASLQQFLAAPSRLIPTPGISGVLNATETKDTMIAGAVLFNRPTDTEIGVVNTTPQPAEIGLSEAAPPAGVITVRISITMT